ncbi:MAG: PTS sugar transporter subunit IIA [Spirochaetales bacterium]|nr:PTS sugar transporter subunit IIA [Spirochaetales bacterium]
MKIVSLLNQELIILNAGVDSKETAIRLLVDRMVKVCKLQNKEEILRGLFEREKLGGTTFPTGIAIPHVRLTNFKDLIIGICTPKTAFMEDNTEVRCLVVILTSAVVSNMYLKTLACFAQISSDEQLWNQLLSASNAGVFLETIKDIYVKKEITTEDIMEREYCVVTPETNLKQLADTLYKSRESYAAVVDLSGNFIGEVNIADLIKVGIPNYAYLVGNLNFVSTLEPFEELLKNEEKITVREIMRKPQIVLKTSTSVIEAALEITQANRSNLPVVKDKKIVGLLKSSSILHRIIRG